MRRSLHAGAFLALAAAFSLAPTPHPTAAQARTQAPEPFPTIAERTRDMEKRDGFIPVYWDARTGKIWLEIGRFGEEVL